MPAAPTLVLLALYLAAMLVVGLGDRRRAGRSREAFFLADRSLGRGRTFAGLASTTTGGSTTIVLAAAVASRGLPGLWYDLAGAIGLVLLGLLLAGKVRRLRATTLPEIAGRMYGPSVRRTASLLVIASEIVWFALLTQATQAVLSAALGVSADVALVVSATVFVGYTLLGGQYSVIRTDVIQYAIMWVGLVFVAAPFAIRAAGGAGFAARLPEWFWSFPSGPRMRPGEVVAILLTIGLPHLVGSDVYGKLLSARDEGTARFAALGAGGAKLLFGMAIAAIGAAAIPLGTAAGAETLPRTVLAVVPAPLAAFVVVALVATMQSSCDSVLLTAVATTTEDLAPGLVPPGRSPVGVGRLLALLFGALGLAVALVLRDLIETLRLGYTIFASGLILPILFGFSTGRARPSASWARGAMMTGGVVAVCARAARPSVERTLAASGWPLSLADPILPGLAACGAVLLLGSVRTLASGRCRGEDLPERG
jgi:SSS family solute:Na+ symporter